MFSNISSDRVKNQNTKERRLDAAHKGCVSDGSRERIYGGGERVLGGSTKGCKHLTTSRWKEKRREPLVDMFREGIKFAKITRSK